MLFGLGEFSDAFAPVEGHTFGELWSPKGRFVYHLSACV